MSHNIIKSFIGGMAFTCAVAAMTCAPSQTATAAVGVPSAMVDLTGAAESAVNSVVYIKVTMASKQQQMEYFSPFDDFFGDFFGFGNGQKRRQQVETPKRKASGSGVIISSDGYIVTNNHVVQDADEILVKLNDKKEYKGRIIGTDKTTDLALIKVEAEGLPAIPIGDSDKLKLGEWVLAVGNPFNLTSTVTAGIVSAKSRSLNANDVESFIQTDAAINAGNSGGALVNAKGELVGINAMLYSQTGSFSGYGFAIPTTIMNKVVDDLKKYGTVQRALLGIQGSDLSKYIDDQKDKGKTDADLDFGTNEGVIIIEVPVDGAAAAAGIEEKDVITAVDGKDVHSMAALQEILATHRPGDKVNVTFLRNKKQYTKAVTLRNIQGTTDQVSDVDPNSLGVALKPLTSEQKRELALSNGLMVISVKEGKMKDAGISKGLIILEVNDKKMNTTSDFDEAVKAANASKDPVLWIKAKTQSGLPKSFAVDLSNDEKK
ncbi:MAG: Do family serine endopeptidase [Bacteroidaceae bacterium]|nr:Do family serine endopeptidase [Bacteroidaceae bacterium]